ncbi:MAG: glycerophosphoryl diester phosphodiesterase [Rhodospirillaceae bacterium]|nr:glycerophosphoryl diester phosphodiesterase [Rhodospirillaceae bacterium]
MGENIPTILPKIIGHRGACGSAPENTLASIARAIELGAPAVEFDATISRDGHPVIMHDFNVDRCSDGHGPVVLKTLDEISQIDAGSWFSPQFKNERIPPLSDALALVLSSNIVLNLEIKPTLGWEEPTARAVAETLQKVWPEDRQILVSSMSTLALDVFHELMPNIPLGLIVYAVPDNWRDLLDRHVCHSLHCNPAFVTQELITAVHASGHRLHIYTINDPAQAQALFDMGVDAVFTDHPDRLLAS